MFQVRSISAQIFEIQLRFSRFSPDPSETQPRPEIEPRLFCMQTHGSPPLPPFLLESIAAQHCSIILPTTLKLHDFFTRSLEMQRTMSNLPQIAQVVQFDWFLVLSNQITPYFCTFSGFSF